VSGPVADVYAEAIHRVLQEGERLLARLSEPDGKADWTQAWAERDWAFTELQELLTAPGMNELPAWPRIREGITQILAQNDRITSLLRRRQAEVHERLLRLEEGARFRQAYGKRAFARRQMHIWDRTV
jgi:hypothetical protein